MVLLVQQPATPRFSPPSCWGGDLCVNLNEISLILHLHIRCFCGQKAFAVRAGEARVCLCPCSVSLHCADPCLYQQDLAACGIWWLPTIKSLTTHMSLWWGCSSLLTEMLWNVAYEKSKPKCFCNSMWGKTNVGVHENIPASLLTRAGRGGGGSFCAFVKRIK